MADWRKILHNAPVPNEGSLRKLKIVSGGQAGADRAALDWAIAHGLPHGGWCPKGRWAEDGRIAAKYRLKESLSSVPAERTEWNVRDSDGTVIFSTSRYLSGGSLLTAQLARKHQKPLLHIAKGSRTPARKLNDFIQQHGIRILNVAGPRASKEPKIAQFVTAVLDEFANIRQ